MKRTDSQLALEYYQAAPRGPVAHGATPETCCAPLTWAAVEFAFGSSALAVLQSLGRIGDLDRLACGDLRNPHRADRRRTCSRRNLVFLVGASSHYIQL